MTYLVLDGDTGNLLGAYDTERGALDAVARDVARLGDAAFADVGLMLDGWPDGARLIAEGADLVRLAGPA